ncbi:hypothetical protein FGL91_13455 [Microbacterium sp. CBA3102]|uniref:hypothetical protein n=1 Tax=Microbacterium sp. CBA3102 TaxID=2603598 RepID=UPI0011BBBB67|nr:hypothetical protein [Microbacterium sp. CBA3102]QEA29476.1 hypothetical protein FGL91_13455 [Microbacterium sp. CBA3102]
MAQLLHRHGDVFVMSFENPGLLDQLELQHSQHDRIGRHARDDLADPVSAHLRRGKERDVDDVRELFGLRR